MEMGGDSRGLRPLTMLPTLILLAFAAGTDGLRGTLAVSAQDWTTRPELRINAPGDTSSGFGRGSYLSVRPDGTRIVVWDAEPVDYTTTVWRIRIYSPDGGLILDMGPDDFPDDLGQPREVWAGASGFRVGHRDRVTWYSYGDGSPGETVFLPRELESPLSLADGGFLGLPSLPIDHSGWQPVVRLANGNGERAPDTIAVLDRRNLWLSITFRDSRQRRSFGSSISGQPFAGADLWWMDVESGSIGVVRKGEPPGVTEVFEILASGDTTWHRHLSLPPVPLSSERAEDAIAEKVDTLRAQAESYGLTEAQLRTVVEDALHIPSHLSPVTRVVAAASGEVWLRAREMDNGMAVWYAIRRGDHESAPRRVLLPATFRLNDAFGDHVWGFTSGAGPIRILGLRLVPPPLP